MDDVSADARALLSLVRLDGVGASPLLVARRLGLRVIAVPRARIAARCRAQLLDDRIVVAASADDRERALLVGHELGHWFAARFALDLEDEEAYAWAFAEALTSL